MSVTALDHACVATRDLTQLAGQYERLGFALTPLARYSDGRIGNRCAMLRHGYLELLAVVDPKASSATLDRFLARYAGIHILAFAIADEGAALARLRRANIDVPRAVRFERPVDPVGGGPHARFSLITAPDQPEGRINLVQHHTPELLWQERFLGHPNSAVALAEVIIAVSDPADAAARFSRILGRPAVPDPAGGFAIGLAQGRVRLLAGTALHRVLAGISPPTVPSIVGLTIRTSDANAAIDRLVTGHGIAHRRDAAGVVVEPSDGGGVALRFSPVP